MDSRTGKLVRLGRILRPDTGRSLCIAFSHGALLGPIEGMRTEEDMHAVLDTVSGADGVMVSPGMLPRFEQHFVGRAAPALIVMADWQNVGRAQRGGFPSGPGGSDVLVTAEQALAAGSDAIMTYLWLGGDDPDREREEIRRNSLVVRECERLGLPVLIESRGFAIESR